MTCELLSTLRRAGLALASLALSACGGSRDADPDAAFLAERGERFQAACEATELAFAGRVLRVGSAPPPIASGRGAALQSVSYRVLEVLKGDFDLAKSPELTIQHAVIANSRSAALVDGKLQLAPGRFRPGAELLVLARRDPDLGWQDVHQDLSGVAATPATREILRRWLTPAEDRR